MPLLNFQFGLSVSKESQISNVENLKKAGQVGSVCQVDPDSADETISRMWYAECSDEDALHRLKGYLERVPGVVSVEEPPRRTLIW